MSEFADRIHDAIRKRDKIYELCRKAGRPEFAFDFLDEEIDAEILVQLLDEINAAVEGRRAAKALLPIGASLSTVH